MGLLATGLLAACSASSDDSTTEFPPAPGAVDRDLTAPDVDAGEVFDDAAEAGSPAGGGGIGFDIGTIGRDVAIEMRIRMRSDDLRATVEGIASDASARGGGIAASDIDFGTDERPGRATLVVKVPPRAIDGLLGRLDELGEVTSVGQDAVDVTDQLVDLEVRIRNAEQSVDRVRALLTEASDLREVIDLESELTRRQTDLERLLASQRTLRERVALATLTIDVLPTEAPVEPVEPTDPGILDGLRTGWDGFVAVLFGLAYGAAVLAPVLALGLVALLVTWLVLRRRRTGGDNGTGTTGTDATGSPTSPAGATSSTGTAGTTGASGTAGAVTSPGSTSPER